MEEQQRQLERKVQRLQDLLRIYRASLGLAVLLVIVLTTLLICGKAPRYGRAILINGKVVAMVRNEKAATAVREHLLAEGKGGAVGQATFLQSWEDEPSPVDGARLLSVPEAEKLLRPRLTVVVGAFAIEANGLQLVVVPTREAAELVLNKLMFRYIAKDESVTRLPRLKPEPVIRPTTAPPSEVVTDVSEAVARLADARTQPETYVVKPGDCLEKIAAHFNMPVPALRRLNPQAKDKAMHPGQRLKVLGNNCGLTVVTVKQVTDTQEISPPVVRQLSPSLPKGETKVAFPGKPGRKSIQWQITLHNNKEIARKDLHEEVVLQPEPKRMLVGTGRG